MEDIFTIPKSPNVIYHIKRIEDKNHMIILKYAEKSWQYLTHFHDKKQPTTRNKNEIPQHDKRHQQKANYRVNVKSIKSIVTFLQK